MIQIPEDRISSETWPTLTVMVNVFNEHQQEMITNGSVDCIAFEIFNELTRMKATPMLAGHCDLMEAAQCFVAVMLKKQLQGSNCFDRYLDSDYAESLRNLTTFSADDIMSGTVTHRGGLPDISVGIRGYCPDCDKTRFNRDNASRLLSR